MNSRAVALVLLLGSCGGRGDRPPPAAGRTAEAAPAADSLALTAPGGVEVWYTLSRAVHAPDGTTCVDRGLEIRQGDTRIPVPLLYTGTAPELVNDTTIRARLSTNCAPGDSYLVSLRTGRPTRER